MKLNLKNLLVTATTAHFPLDICKGMTVELTYSDKNLLASIHDKSLVQQFDSETGAPYKELDTDLYVKTFVKEVVVGWKGFTGEHLASLVLIDEASIDLAEEVDFDIETAEFLLKNSPVFDRWVVATAKRLSNFRISK